MAAQASRPPRGEISDAPSPNNSPVVLRRTPQEAAIQTSTARLTLLNGVFYSKYAVAAQ